MDAKTLGQQPVNAGEFDYIGSNRAAANGITKRELFAAMAMQGLLASSVDGLWPAFAESAVRAADALLAELSREQNNDR